MDEEIKLKVKEFWNKQPCGTTFSNEEIGTPEFFESVRKHRYEVVWEIPEIVRFDEYERNKILEIGCGIGTDLVEFAKGGASVTGIDLSPNAVALAQKRFQLYNLDGDIRVADAEKLPFEDNTFDFVYSFGVLHHTPDTQKAIEEAYRVLKPGGKMIVMLYHRHSYIYICKIMFFTRIGLRLLNSRIWFSFIGKIINFDSEYLARYRQQVKLKRTLTKQELINISTDGPENPLSKVYSKKQVKVLFKSFKKVRTQIHHLNKRWIPVVGRSLPRWIEKPLSRIMGWHLYVFAEQ